MSDEASVRDAIGATIERYGTLTTLDQQRRADRPRERGHEADARARHPEEWERDRARPLLTGDAFWLKRQRQLQRLVEIARRGHSRRAAGFMRASRTGGRRSRALPADALRASAAKNWPMIDPRRAVEQAAADAATLPPIAAS